VSIARSANAAGHNGTIDVENVVMQYETLLRAILVFVEMIQRSHSLAPIAIDADTDLFATQILDSARLVELVFFLVEDLGIDVSDRELDPSFFQSPRVIADNFGLRGAP
jgi:acyl carrier protein